MSIRSWFDSLNHRSSRAPVRHARRGARRRQPASRRLAIEALEDRRVLAAVVSVGDVAILEGNDGTQSAAVTVNVCKPQGKSVTVNYSTVNGTATAGSDYNAASGKLTFAKGQTSKRILVPVIGDRITELDETFFVNLRNAKGAKIANRQAVVTIIDNEPRISISDVQASEANSGTTPFSACHLPMTCR
jgi:endoglucanase